MKKPMYINFSIIITELHSTVAWEKYYPNNFRKE